MGRAARAVVRGAASDIIPGQGLWTIAEAARSALIVYDLWQESNVVFRNRYKTLREGMRGREFQVAYVEIPPLQSPIGQPVKPVSNQHHEFLLGGIP